MNPYIYPSGERIVNLHLEDTSLRWLHYTVDFPTAHPTRYEENNTVRGEYFQPRKAGAAPLAILLHGIGDRSVIPCKLLARALVKKEMACFILYLVFHSSRMPKTLNKGIPRLTPEEWLESYQVSVVDVRQVIDWASTRANVSLVIGKLAELRELSSTASTKKCVTPDFTPHHHTPILSSPNGDELR